MARDAAEIRPKFVPDEQLLPRDNSGGIDWTPRTQKWGDGGEVLGAKSYLSASGGSEKNTDGDEQPKEKLLGKRDKRD
jgi:hypothetical protein